MLQSAGSVANMNLFEATITTADLEKCLFFLKWKASCLYSHPPQIFFDSHQQWGNDSNGSEHNWYLKWYSYHFNVYNMVKSRTLGIHHTGASLHTWRHLTRVWFLLDTTRMKAGVISAPETSRTWHTENETGPKSSSKHCTSSGSTWNNVRRTQKVSFENWPGFVLTWNLFSLPTHSTFETNGQMSLM